MSLNQFLESRGFFLTPVSSQQNEGFLTPAQAEQFASQLARYPKLKKIAEIGFNAGHSAECFFTHCKQLTLFTAFDINIYPYTEHAAEYFSKTYKRRFTFIRGDSLIQVPKMSKKKPDLKFDLIYIDGCHTYQWVLGDIFNASKMAHRDSILWIDDIQYNSIAEAVLLWQTLGLLQIEKTFSSHDPQYGHRKWIQAKIAV